MRIVNLFLIAISVALIFSSCSTTANVQVEKDPLYIASPAASIKTTDIPYWNKTADTVKWSVYKKTETYSAAQIDAKIAGVSGGNCNCYTKTESDTRYIKTETDPLFSVSAAKTITSADIAKWNNGGGTIDAFTKAESNALFAPIGHTHSIAQILSLQPTLDSKATNTQLKDSCSKLNQKIDYLQKRFDSVYHFLHDDTSAFYKVTDFGVQVAINTYTPAKKAIYIKDSLLAQSARTTIVLTKYIASKGDNAYDTYAKKNLLYNSMLIMSLKQMGKLPLHEHSLLI